jgi:hypothetical protein
MNPWQFSAANPQLGSVMKELMQSVKILNKEKYSLNRCQYARQPDQGLSRKDTIYFKIGMKNLMEEM